ncbi:MAG: hypothetical protein ABIO16_18730 [Nocardioides sp.]
MWWARAAASAGAAALAAAVLTNPAPAGAAPPWLDQVRDSTQPFQSLEAAKADGYGKLKDAAGIGCIDNPPDGGMGVHFVNGDLVGDAVANATTPEVLVYEPTADGMKLVALEYVVFRKAWRAEHATGRPQLFGQKFELLGKDNRYGLPPFYELHLWAWKKNPSGMFDDWNPRVVC